MAALHKPCHINLLKIGKIIKFIFYSYTNIMGEQYLVKANKRSTENINIFISIPYKNNTKNADYKLRAFINRYGNNTESGHFTFTCVDDKTGSNRFIYIFFLLCFNFA